MRFFKNKKKLTLLFAFKKCLTLGKHTVTAEEKVVAFIIVDTIIIINHYSAKARVISLNS